MRVTLTSLSLLSLSMLATVSVASNQDSSDTSSRVIVSKEAGQHFHTKANHEFYLQAATFKSIKYAENYQHHLANKVQYPTTVQARGNYQVVLIGPIHTAAEVRALSRSMLGSKRIVKPELITNNNTAPMHVGVGAVDKYAVLMQDMVANHFEIIGAVGVATVDAGNSELGVTSSETDRLIQSNNNWNDFTGQVGVGYVNYFRDIPLYPDHIEWLTAIEPQVNAYYIGGKNIVGDVWRFDSADFNDLTYSMPFNSTRVMFDTSLTIATRQHLSLYAIGGIGSAWNRLGYSDADKETLPCPDQRLNLNSRTDSSFAWEVGAGLQYAFNQRAALSLEYLYTDLGSVKLSNQGNAGTITTPVINSGSFHLNSQAALLGLHIAI